MLTSTTAAPLLNRYLQYLKFLCKNIGLSTPVSRILLPEAFRHTGYTLVDLDFYFLKIFGNCVIFSPSWDTIPIDIRSMVGRDFVGIPKRRKDCCPSMNSVSK
jgi:hypothetical protein